MPAAGSTGLPSATGRSEEAGKVRVFLAKALWKQKQKDSSFSPGFFHSWASTASQSAGLGL